MWKVLRDTAVKLSICINQVGPGESEVKWWVPRRRARKMGPAEAGEVWEEMTWQDLTAKPSAL